MANFRKIPMRDILKLQIEAKAFNNFLDTLHSNNKAPSLAFAGMIFTRMMQYLMDFELGKCDDLINFVEATGCSQELKDLMQAFRQKIASEENITIEWPNTIGD